MANWKKNIDKILTFLTCIIIKSISNSSSHVFFFENGVLQKFDKLVCRKHQNTFNFLSEAQLSPKYDTEPTKCCNISLGTIVLTPWEFSSHQIVFLVQVWPHNLRKWYFSLAQFFVSGRRIINHIFCKLLQKMFHL